MNMKGYTVINVLFKVYVAYCKEYINITIINAIPRVRIQIVLLEF